jgi:hypothetical protein
MTRHFLVVLGILVCPAVASALTTLIDSGPSANRVDIVFLGDGYTQANLNSGVYTSHVDAYLDYMFGPSALADPFSRYHNFFNAHAIEVVSNQSGADQPPNGIFRDTALDATYFSNSTERLLTVSTSKTNAQRNLGLAGTGVTADMQFVVVNDTKYGGSGGTYAVFAGGNASSKEIALHEVAHSFSRLADEYVSYNSPYTGGEPIEVNVTKNAGGAKWSRWLGYDDPRGSNLDIGVYEGARYYETGVYRPSLDSKMRSLNRPFDAVSREKLIQDIYRYVDPLDGFLSNSGVLINPDELWVDVVDADVILVEWSVNGVLSMANTDETFDVALEGLGPGSHAITARAYDEVLDYSFTGGTLDLVRSGYSAMEQFVSWTVLIPVAGDYDRNGVVDAADYDVWRDAYGSTELLNADGNDDGIVDAADYVVWRDALNSAAATARIPEPAGAVLLAAALLTSCVARSRKHA